MLQLNSKKELESHNEYNDWGKAPPATNLLQFILRQVAGVWIDALIWHQGGPGGHIASGGCGRHGEVGINAHQRKGH